MSGVALHVETADSELACFWQENPYRLVSLWRMLQVHAVQFATLLDHLGKIEQQCIGHSFEAGAFGQVLSAVQHDCTQLELISASKQIERIWLILREHDAGRIPLRYQDLTPPISELRRRIEEDLEESVFYQIEPERVRSCFMRSRTDNLTEFSVKTPEELFGTGVAASFPSASFDITEACKCLAFDRSTACVFHLMRVLELALAPMGTVFGVSLTHTNWGTAIDQIESNIRKMSNDLKWTSQADWKDQQEFYSQSATHFRVLKDAWRNYTAHARGKYNPDEATDIMLGVRGFMQKLATRLHE